MAVLSSANLLLNHHDHDDFCDLYNIDDNENGDDDEDDTNGGGNPLLDKPPPKPSR